MSDFKKFFSLKEKTWSKFHVLVLSVLGLITVFLIVQMAQFVRIRHQLQFIDALEDNNATVIEEMSLAKNYLSNFGGDLNQIREYLLLPTKDYNFEDLGQVEANADEDGFDDLSTLVYTFVDRLGAYEEQQKIYQENLEGVKAFLADPVWGENLLFVEDFTVYDDSLEGMQVMDIVLDLDGTFTITTYGGEMELTDADNFESVKADLQVWLSGITELRDLLRLVNENRNFVMNSVLANADFQTLLAEKGVGVTEERDEGKYYAHSFFNGDGMTLAEMYLYMADSEAGTMALVIGEDMPLEFGMDAAGLQILMDNLGAVDSRTATEILVDEHVSELKALIKDKAFAATFENAGLTMGEMVETEDRLSFPIISAEGEILRTLYLDKSTGEVMVEDADGSITTLSAAIEGLNFSGKKKRWTCQRPCLSMVT